MTRIIPAIDIIGGRCVRLTKGDYGSGKVYDCSPVEMAMRYADCGVSRIHMVDLDGARDSQPRNLRTLEEVASKLGVEIEWGGGISSSEALSSVFSAGATQAIIGSVAAVRPDDFRGWLKEYGAAKMLLGSDVRDGAVAVKGWLDQTELRIEDQIAGFLPDGLKYIICTDISRDGMLQGPASGLYRALMEKFPSIIFTASGGVSGMADIVRLAEDGVPNVIVGKAIYEKRITLEDIERWSRNA